MNSDFLVGDIKLNNQERQIISVEDMRQLVTLDIPILDKAILMILAKTGIRRGEFIAIDREDLNLEKQEIILKQVLFGVHPQAYATKDLIRNEKTIVVKITNLFYKSGK